jgi:hypothetical protein
MAVNEPVLIIYLFKMKRRPKCELNPVSEYEATPPIAYIDNSHRYFKGPKG